MAYVSLGSNLGDTERNLAAARELLGRVPDLFPEAASSLYRTEPQGNRDQPWFLNQVVAVRCGPLVHPRLLLRALLEIELAMGRERTVPLGPRVIDLDLLLFGDQVIESQELILPHPRMRERAFVLVPLQEISPKLTFPDGETIEILLARLSYRLNGNRISQ